MYKGVSKTRQTMTELSQHHFLSAWNLAVKYFQATVSSMLFEEFVTGKFTKPKDKRTTPKTTYTFQFNWVLMTRDLGWLSLFHIQGNSNKHTHTRTHARVHTHAHTHKQARTCTHTSKDSHSMIPIHKQMLSNHHAGKV